MVQRRDEDSGLSDMGVQGPDIVASSDRSIAKLLIGADVELVNFPPFSP